VIDVYVRISLVGIELLTIDARIVLPSVDTYLCYAEAVGRLNLGSGRKRGAQDLIAGGKTENAIEAATDQLGEMFGAVGCAWSLPRSTGHGGGHRPVTRVKDRMAERQPDDLRGAAKVAPRLLEARDRAAGSSFASASRELWWMTPERSDSP
jgi:hypothetical protein